MKPLKVSAILASVCLLFLVACAQKRPALYPNTHLKRVGNEGAQADIDECMRLAAEYVGVTNSGERVGKGTTMGAAVGGASGAAVGAVFGRVGRGAAAGAAGGAAGGAYQGRNSFTRAKSCIYAICGKMPP